MMVGKNGTWMCVCVQSVVMIRVLRRGGTREAKRSRFCKGDRRVERMLTAG